jgi:DNA-binding transcriptional MerR regulator
MAYYSIRDLEKLTGIKAHTIRIWEQRYQLISPARTETNIRFYTDDNLRHLFNIALLNKQGLKISHIAKLHPEEVNARATDIAQNGSGQNAHIDSLTLAMIDLDEAAFDRVYTAYHWEHGFERTMLEVIYPFLDKLNVLWLTNSVSAAHERFISSLIRRKLMTAIDQEPLHVNRDAETFLLYSPEGDAQELTLLFMHYLLRSRQHRVIYLGTNTTLGDLRDACQTLKPNYIFTILQEPLARQSVQNYVDHASSCASSSQLLLTGAQMFVNPVKLPLNVKVLNGLPDTLQFLDALKRRK